ncbi:hypothetical protein L208DRAFT_1385784, partial [Tricholoma matsutake]
TWTASERLDALESNISGIHAQIDSLKSTIENFVRTLQTNPMTNIPPIATPSAPNNDIKLSPPTEFNGALCAGTCIP